MIWLGWIILGAVAGWVASRIVEEPRGSFKYISVGILGALIGGVLFIPMKSGVTMPGLNMYGFIVALLGSLILIWATRMAKGSE